MTRIAKFVGVLVSIAIFVMPAAAMPFRCLLMTSTREGANPCHMMAMTPSPDASQLGANVDHSCCQVSAARPESMTVPAASGKWTIAPPAVTVTLVDLSAAPVRRDVLDFAPSPGGPPLAVLCTFLI